MNQNSTHIPNWLESLLSSVEKAVPEIVVELWRHRLRRDCLEGRPTAIKKGEHRRDIYTTEDRRAESFLRDELRDRIKKEVGVISEEFTRDPERIPGGTFWVIDAIDGTLNFSRGYPHYTSSVALVHESAVVYGCIFQPALRELFTAKIARGVRFGECRLPRLEREDLADVIVAVGHGYDDARATIMTELIGRLQPRVRAIRQSGCASEDLAYAAAGRVGCFVHPYLKNWDRNAGELLVREAGGVVEYVAELQTETTRALVAGNPWIVDLVMREFEIAGSSFDWAKK